MRLPHHLSVLTLRCRTRARRILTALAYLRGRLTSDQAYDLLFAAENRLGRWSLAAIDAEGVRKRVRDIYHDDPRLEILAFAAASRVAHKWPDDGETRSAAIDCAANLVEDYARAEGVTLVAREPDER